ncbi:MAG: hypothetical protein QXK38_07305 [Candidatus Caldarchaeum sp.]
MNVAYLPTSKARFVKSEDLHEERVGGFESHPPHTLSARTCRLGVFG